MVEVLAKGFDAVAAARRVKLVCLDVDGTLADSAKRIPSENVRAVHDAVAAGITVAVSSGRHPFNVEELMADDLGLPFTAVCLSGGAVFLDGAEVHRHPISDDAVRAVVHAAAALNCFVALSGADFNITAGYIDRGPGPMAPSVRRYVNLPSHDELLARAGDDEHRGRILKCALHVENERDMAQLRRELARIPHVAVVRSDTDWLDVTDSDCTKAEGIAALCKALGCALEQVAAVGDDENDIASIGAVGLGIAMSNALPEVKRLAKVQVGSNDEAGVAEAIDFILRVRA